MSLRAKVLALFGAFAIAPLLAVGVIDYVRSVRAVDALVRAQTAQIAERVAAEVEDRYELLQANLMLLASNSETQRLLQRHAPLDVPTKRRVDAYLQRVWNAAGDDLQWAVLTDGAGGEIYRLGARSGDTNAADTYTVTALSSTDAARASVTATIRLAGLLPADALAARFGHGGYNVLVDRQSGRVLYGAEHANTISDLARPSADSETHLMFAEEGTRRSATRVRLTSPPWDVLAVASLDEFARPFTAIRSANLLLVLATTLFAGLAFFVLLWRATRSLAMLTVAADAVGRGNLQPSLPSSSRDEVGRLASAFAIMVGRVRETMAEIERSRQMAVVGEFASRIAHEIRNPLTSIKLNMQKLERASRAGRLPADAEKPLEITLREIQRLDRVVHGVLQLGRAPSSVRDHVRLADLVVDTAEVARPQIERGGVTLEVSAGAPADEWDVRGDAALLSGALLNVLFNAAAAAGPGGTVRVDVEHDDGVARVRVRDDGPGVPPGDRDRVFEPFYTTKEGGTGLGLAVAQTTVEEHGGTIRVLDESPGATFVIELPSAMREPAS